MLSDLHRAGQTVTAGTAQCCISGKSYFLLPPTVNEATSTLSTFQLPQMCSYTSHCHQVTSSSPGHHPSARACTGAQGSQLGQHFCNALSPHSLPTVPEPWLSQPSPRLSPDRAAQSSIPRSMQKVMVPLALRSPTASMLQAGAAGR